MTERIYGEVVPYKLNAKEWTSFEEARKQGFVVISGRSRINLPNTWFIWCEASDLPYVKIIPRRKYADVEYDFIAWSRKLTVNGAEAMRNLWRQRFHLRRRAGGWFLPGEIIGLFPAGMDEAESVARLVLGIIAADGNTVPVYEGNGR